MAQEELGKIGKTEEPEEGHFFLSVAEGSLEAYLMVCKKKKGDYTLQEVLAYLKSQNIVYGLRKEAIEKIVAGQCYDREILVARGKKPVAGVDGYFEFHFEVAPKTKPIILGDGSVDYNTLGQIELVDQDQPLATYHKAVPPVAGQNVHGKPLSVPAAREKRPLSGKGFYMDEEQMRYYASYEGSVSFKAGRLEVEPVYVIRRDVEATTGDVFFKGDILVQGNVSANAVIHATGSITVNGNVEMASLIAGTDVILKNGMSSDGGGSIQAGGDVMAKFLEHTKVEAQGSVSANAIFHCEVSAGKEVTVSGKRGAILGGRVQAVERITATSLGNRAGVETKLIIGLEENFNLLMMRIDEEIEDLRERFPGIEDDDSQIRELQEKKEEFSKTYEGSLGGSVAAVGTAYAGTVVILNGLKEKLCEDCKDVAFVAVENEICRNHG